MVTGCSSQVFHLELSCFSTQIVYKVLQLPVWTQVWARALQYGCGAFEMQLVQIEMCCKCKNQLILKTLGEKKLSVIFLY